jgi:hypothetical protein
MTLDKWLRLSLFTRERRTQRSPRTARRARVRSFAKALSRCCRGPLHPPRSGDARSPWLTPAPAALPRPSAQTPPYMTPRAPRRSLPQSVLGPGSRIPPAAFSSAGHQVRHLPSSPGRQSRRRTPPAETWLPAGAANQGSPQAPPPASGKCACDAGAWPGRGRGCRARA